VAQRPLLPTNAREITALTERIKQLQAAGKTEEAKKLTVRLAILKRASARPNRALPHPALPRIKPAQVTADKKKRLIRSAYLRTLTRYPDERESARALAYLNNSKDIASGLRDLMWALVNTEEFIVNH
jgi:hypothetical protein